MKHVSNPIIIDSRNVLISAMEENGGKRMRGRTRGRGRGRTRGGRASRGRSKKQVKVNQFSSGIKSITSKNQFKYFCQLIPQYNTYIK